MNILRACWQYVSEILFKKRLTAVKKLMPMTSRRAESIKSKVKPRYVILLAAVFMLSACIVLASAQDENLEAASVDIDVGSPASGVGFTYNGSDTITIEANGDYRIIGSTTTNSILINGGLAGVRITLQDTSIVRTGNNECAFNIVTGSTVDMTLVGDNELKSGVSRAGLQIANGAKLTISASSTGTLEATGGNDGAGIGSGKDENAGTMEINGGLIFATGGSNAAGIGAGNGSTGGTLNMDGNASVFASSVDAAMGVMAGGMLFDGDDGTVYGNVVLSDDLLLSDTMTLTVTEGSTLIIPSGITLNNYGRIVNNGTINNFGVFVNWTLVTNNGLIREEGLWFGNLPAVNIFSKLETIDMGNPISNSLRWEYDDVTKTVTILRNGDYLIRGATAENGIVIAPGLNNVNIELKSASIRISEADKSAFEISAGSTVFLTLFGKNTLLSGDHRAGLEVPEGAALIVTKSSTGRLNVTGGYAGAGIGGNGIVDDTDDAFGANGGTVIINGGTVTAAGGYGASGIGGGGAESGAYSTTGGDGGTVIINGGTITAAGGLGAADIGGGGAMSKAGNTNNATGGDGGTVTINGGTVMAIGEYGAGIGGGGVMTDDGIATGGDGGTVTINGGTVTITSEIGAGIGGGLATNATAGDAFGGNGGTVTINGGTVTITSEIGAGIGGGAAISSAGNATSGDGGTVTINGGTVTITSEIGAGIGEGLADSAISATIGNAGTLDMDSNALVFASSVSDTTTLRTGGILVIDGYAAEFYGGPVTLDHDAVIPFGKTLTIEAGGVLVNEGTMDVYGVLIIEGTFTNNGTINNFSVIENSENLTNNGDIFGNEPFLSSNVIDIDAYGGKLIINSAGNYLIKGSGTTSNSIEVTGGTKNVRITLWNVNIDSNYAFNIYSGAEVELTLIGHNYLKSNSGGSAGLAVPAGAKLTITENSTGSLTVTGDGHGAGIGGWNRSAAGIIIINGGTIEANGGYDAAGIGGGGDNTNTGNGGAGGTIIINGGTIEANGGNKWNAAGIGGGTNASSGDITISGGTIIATGGESAAGIGGGGGYTLPGGGVGTITINGGNIKAIGGQWASGIGNGDGGVAGGTITINGGTIEAIGGPDNSDGGGGAGIGGGGWGGSTTVNINGGTIIASGGNGGAGIGGGGNGSSGVVNMNGNALVFATSVTTLVEKTGGILAIEGGPVQFFTDTVLLNYDASVPSGMTLEMPVGKTIIVGLGNTFTISGTLNNNGTIINYGTIFNKGTVSNVTNSGIIRQFGEWIGAQPVPAPITGPIVIDMNGLTDGDHGNWKYEESSGLITILTNGDFIIIGTGKTSTEDHILVASGLNNVNITLENVNIVMSPATHESAFNITGATVNLTLVGDNFLAGGENRAGLEVPVGATLIITEDSSGNLTATGGGETEFVAGGGAGIGSSDGDDSGIITINGGTVTAIGGFDGAGIGGGKQGAGGVITINGGTVTATGGIGGAGIGGGAFRDSGIITINGGTVTAMSENTGAGIGGGYDGDGEVITINGGTVTAIGGIETGGSAGGAGIGGGWQGAGGNVVINGGTVNATGSKSGAGIGGGDSGGAVGTIIINGGMVTATGGIYAAGIGGGGWESVIGTVTINGGTVIATGGIDAAGIGGGNEGSGSAVTINGGVVIATGGTTGIGGGDESEGPSTVTNGTLVVNGDAIVIASAVNALTTLTKGILSINGNTQWENVPAEFALNQDMIIPEGIVFTVPFEKTLVNNGNMAIYGLLVVRGMLTNSGLIDNQGAIENHGQIISDSNRFFGNVPFTVLFVIDTNDLKADASGNWSFSDDTIWINENGNYLIRGNGSVTSDRIKVKEGLTDVNITLMDVNIDVSSSAAAAFDMTDATVKLTILGNNVLKSSNNFAGIQVPEGSELIITASSVGMLDVTSGRGGAGIGGGPNESGGIMTINGGTITATAGGSYGGAAGIGGGNGGASGGIMTINGGTVVATGGEYGAGIGGGENGTGGIMTINGGSVIAKTTGDGAGIGAGHEGTDGGTITITGGTIKATGGSSGAGIGGGERGDGGIITITGGIITAIGGSSGAGIGGGYDGDGGIITITGGIITVTGGSNGAGIGGGYDGDGGTLTMDGNALVFASSANAAITDNSGILTIDGEDSQWFGAAEMLLDFNGSVPSGYVLTIDVGKTLIVGKGVTFVNEGTIVNNGTILNLGTINNESNDFTNNGIIRQLGKWIGPYPSGNQPFSKPGLIYIDDPDQTKGDNWTFAGGVLTIVANGDYVIGGSGEVTTNRIVVASGLNNVNITMFGVNIATTSESAFDMSGAAVNLTLLGKNILQSGSSAGLQVPGGATLIITEHSTGSLKATGSNSGAGIGGGWNQAVGTIIINGGKIEANGGSSAAGIGSGFTGNGGNITINGGTITATGGSDGAGIGSGNDGDTVDVTINGGNVTATGHGSAAGIGGGAFGIGGTITITGGTVTAIQGGNAYSGAGIGNGYGAIGSSTLIMDGNALVFASSVNATIVDNSGILTIDGEDSQWFGAEKTMTLDYHAFVPAGKTLRIPEGYTLVVAKCFSLTNYGTIYCAGELIIEGKFFENDPYFRPVINTDTLADGEAGKDGEWIIDADSSADLPDVTWVISGSPAGLSIDADGKITGIPTVAGTYNVTVEVENIVGKTTKTLVLFIAQGIGSDVTGIDASATDDMVIVTVSGKPTNGQTVEYAISETASVPAVGWQDSNVFTGKDSNTLYYVFARAKANDSFAAGAVPSPETVTTIPIITTATLVNGTVGEDYDEGVGIANGEAYWFVSGLPSGLDAEGTGDMISLVGKPTEAGTFQIVFKAVNEDDDTVFVTRTITLVIEKGKGADVADSTDGGSTHDTISVTAIAEPALQAVEYAISKGTTAPTGGWQPGTVFGGLDSNTMYNVFARSAENKDFKAGDAENIFSIATNPFITTLSLADGKVDVTDYEQLLSAELGTEVITWSSSVLPAGLEIKAGTNKITGTPTVAGIFAVSITAENDDGSFTVMFELEIKKGTGATVSALTGIMTTDTVVQINPVTVTSGKQYAEYAIGLTSDVDDAGTWQTGTVFGGLDSNTLYYVFARSAENKDYEAGEDATAVSTEMITKPFITTGSFNGTVGGSAVDVQLEVTAGGTETVTWNVIGLPAGLSVNASNKIIGTPDAAGTFNVILEAKNTGTPSIKTITVTIAKGTGAAVSGPASGTSTHDTVSVTPITKPAPQSAEYSISTDPDNPGSTWQFGTVFENLDSNTSYYVFARSAGDSNYVEGLPSTSLLVITKPIITTDSFSGKVDGAAVSVDLKITPGGTETVTWKVFGLPAGLQFDEISSKIIGTPETAGIFNVILEAKNVGEPSVRTITVTIAKGDGEAVPADLEAESLSGTSVIVTVVPVLSNGQTLEFFICEFGSSPDASSVWQTGTTLTVAKSNTKYTVFARAAENNDYEAGTLLDLGSANVVTTPIIASVTFTDGEVGKSYELTLSVKEGDETVSWDVFGLPSGLIFDASDKKIKGTPVVTGTFSLVVIAENSGGAYAEVFSLTVKGGEGFKVTGMTVSALSSDTVTVTSVTVPNNGQVLEYAISINDTVPTNPAAWSSETTFTGRVSNTEYFVFVRAAANADHEAGEVFIVPVVTMPVVGNGSLLHGSVGVVYEESLSPKEGHVVTTWTALGLPAELGIEKVGNDYFIKGTPKHAGSYSVTITVTNVSGSDVKVLTLEIWRVAGATIVGPVEGTSTHDTIFVTPIVAPALQSIEYAISTDATEPIDGWQSGTIFAGRESNTPYYVFARAAANSDYYAGTAISSVITTNPIIKTTTLTGGVVGEDYGPVQLEAEGDGSVDWTASNAPAWMTVGINGKITGVPTAVGTFSFTVTATNGNDILATATVTLTVSVAKGEGSTVYDVFDATATSTTITVGPVVIPGAQTEYAISRTVTLSGDAAWQSGNIFSDLIPNTQYFVFIRSAENVDRLAGIPSDGLEVITWPFVVDIALSNGNVGAEYSVTMTLFGGNASNVEWTLTGTIPSGWGINKTTGLVTGIPTAVGEVKFTVRATNSLGGYDEREFTVVVDKGEGFRVFVTIDGVSLTMVTASVIDMPDNGQSVEYAINTSSSIPVNGWQDNGTFAGLIPDVDYFVFARSVGNENYLTGAVSISSRITTDTVGDITIVGDSGMTLREGYEAVSSGVFVITGDGTINVMKVDGDPKVTWNSATKRVDIAEGLAEGTHVVTFRAYSEFASEEFTFTVTVESAQSAMFMTVVILMIIGLLASMLLVGMRRS